MLNLSFCQFLTKFKITKEKAFKLMGITKSPRWLEIVDYGDCLSVEFTMGDKSVSREIDVRDLNMSV